VLSVRDVPPPDQGNTARGMSVRRRQLHGIDDTQKLGLCADGQEYACFNPKEIMVFSGSLTTCGGER